MGENRQGRSACKGCQKLKSILDFFFPPACIACGRKISFTSPAGFCRICYHNLPFIKNSCAKCGRFVANPENHQIARVCRLCLCSKRFFSCGVSALVFASPVRDILLKMKYGHEIYQARYLAALMARAWINSGKALPDCITYVPLTPMKQKQRGFNQSRLLAVHTAARLGLPVIPLLRRVRENDTQAGLALNKRPGNIRECFRPSAFFRNSYDHVMIIDDVMTSGSTLNECSGILLQAGVSNISVLTLMSVEE